MERKLEIALLWISHLIDGKSWAREIESYGYQSIAIYGAGMFCELLIHELDNTSISVEYVVDMRAYQIREFQGIEVITLEELFNKKIDALLVSAITAYDTVLNKVNENTTQLPVMSLEDIIFEF